MLRLVKGHRAVCGYSGVAAWRTGGEKMMICGAGAPEESPHAVCGKGVVGGEGLEPPTFAV